MKGDLIIFNQTLLDQGNGVHNLGTHTFAVGLITSAVTPAVGTPDPRWGAGGGTNYLSNQVALGTAYTGPIQVASRTFGLVGTDAVLDWADIIINKDDVQGFSNARWAIVFNNTVAGKNCLFAIDMGADTTNVTGPVQFSIDPRGMLALRRAA